MLTGLEAQKKTFCETILVAMIDAWTLCWRPLEEKHNDRAMITLYQLKTNANARLNNMAASVCWNKPAAGTLGVNISASQFKLHF